MYCRYYIYNVSLIRKSVKSVFSNFTGDTKNIVVISVFKICQFFKHNYFYKIALFK